MEKSLQMIREDLQRLSQINKVLFESWDDKYAEAFQEEKAAHYERSRENTFRSKAEHLLNRKVPEVYSAYNDYAYPHCCQQHID